MFIISHFSGLLVDCMCHLLQVPAAVLAANIGGLAVPVTSQKQTKTLKDINQNVQNSSPPSSSPKHTGKQSAIDINWP